MRENFLPTDRKAFALTAPMVYICVCLFRVLILYNKSRIQCHLLQAGKIVNPWEVLLLLLLLLSLRRASEVNSWLSLLFEEEDPISLLVLLKSNHLILPFHLEASHTGFAVTEPSPKEVLHVLTSPVLSFL